MAGELEQGLHLRPDGGLVSLGLLQCSDLFALHLDLVGKGLCASSRPRALLFFSGDVGLRSGQFAGRILGLSLSLANLSGAGWCRRLHLLVGRAVAARGSVRNRDEDNGPGSTNTLKEKNYKRVQKYLKNQNNNITNTPTHTFLNILNL